MHSSSCSYISFSKTFDTEREILTGIQLTLSLGSSFLYTVVMSESFNSSGNFWYVQPLLIHFVIESWLFRIIEVIAFQYAKSDLSKCSFIWGNAFYNLYDGSHRSTFKREMFGLFFYFILRMLEWSEKPWIVSCILLVVLLAKRGHLRR